MVQCGRAHCLPPCPDQRSMSVTRGDQRSPDLQHHSEAGLIVQIEHLHVEHDEYDSSKVNNGVGVKHITHAVEKTRYPVELDSRQSVQCAALCLEAAVSSGGEQQLIRAIEDATDPEWPVGTWHRVLAMLAPTHRPPNNEAAMQPEPARVDNLESASSAELSPYSPAERRSPSIRGNPARTPELFPKKCPAQPSTLSHRTMSAAGTPEP